MPENTANRKTILEISALDDRDPVLITEEDKDKTLSTVIMELAEEKQQSGDGLSAQQLRGLLEDNRMFYKNQAVNPNLKIEDLNFESTIYGDETVDFALIELEEPHTGGLPKHEK